MRTFSHNNILADILSKYPKLKVIQQPGNKAYEFEDNNDKMPIGRLEIIPSSKKYFYTIYLSFYSRKHAHIKDSIIEQYKEQKKLFTKNISFINAASRYK